MHWVVAIHQRQNGRTVHRTVTVTIRIPEQFQRANQAHPRWCTIQLDSFLVSGLAQAPCNDTGSTYPSPCHNPMNALIVGSDKSPILNILPDAFLLIDDGALIDAVEMPPRRAVTLFDPALHSFNPLAGMTYARARDFIAVMDAVFPEGESTLTRKNANFVMLTALMNAPGNLDTLIPAKPDNAHIEARQKIQTLLFSPVLKAVLTRPTNISFKHTILARLNRAELGEFDCFVLANLLIAQYPGPVVLPDFGFYACPPHRDLLRQGRLIAGINAFDEVPKFKHTLLLAPTKIPSRCNAEDAKVLALYQGLLPGTNIYNDFIQICIGG